jgi:hypothetical protein
VLDAAGPYGGIDVGGDTGAGDVGAGTIREEAAVAGAAAA